MLETAHVRMEQATNLERLELPPHSEQPFTTAKGYPERAPVPHNCKAWRHEMPEYAPPFYESPTLPQHDRTIVPGGWADPALVTREEFLLWSKTGYMKSFEGPIQHDLQTGRPLNPLGRTGIEGRGHLGKWGPNHAADAVVTRVSPDTGFLEVLLIQRRCGAWAIPGGMVDTGETPLESAYRELTEETGVIMDDTKPRIVYQGIGDGPRVTDNAWVETSAYHFHLDATSKIVDVIPQGLTDAVDAKWATVTPDLIRSLYANHGEILSMALSQFRVTEKSLPLGVQIQLADTPHVPLLTNISHLRGKIGIFGGSFDPVHNAHLEVGREVAAHHGLDAVIYIPTGHNPLKVNAPIASPQERVDMLHYALRNDRTMFVSPMEARVPGIAYTVETLQRLRRELSPDQCRLYLIIGADSLESLSKWKDYNRIPELAEVIPVARPGVSDVTNDPQLIAKLTAELGRDEVERILNNSVPYTGNPLSATEVRKQLRDEIKNIAIPSDVYRYSTARGIYI